MTKSPLAAAAAAVAAETYQELLLERNENRDSGIQFHTQQLQQSLLAMTVSSERRTPEDHNKAAATARATAPARTARQMEFPTKSVGKGGVLQPPSSQRRNDGKMRSSTHPQPPSSSGGGSDEQGQQQQQQKERSESYLVDSDCYIEDQDITTTTTSAVAILRDCPDDDEAGDRENGTDVTILSRNSTDATGLDEADAPWTGLRQRFAPNPASTGNKKLQHLCSPWGPCNPVFPDFGIALSDDGSSISQAGEENSEDHVNDDGVSKHIPTPKSSSNRDVAAAARGQDSTNKMGSSGKTTNTNRLPNRRGDGSWKERTTTTTTGDGSSFEDDTATTTTSYDDDDDSVTAGSLSTCIVAVPLWHAWGCSALFGQ
jgi:hypothetical protein